MGTDFETETSKENKEMMTLLIIATVIAVFSAVISTAIVYSRRSQEAIEKAEENFGHMVIYNAMPRQPYTITSFDGYQLSAEFIPSPEPSDKYVIITHGFQYNRLGSVKYADMFRKHNFNCVIYDNRGHGVNKKAPCTFGIKESKDLLAVIEDTYNRYGKDIILGLHGESMGAGLTIYALRYKPDVKFVVADCGYAELADSLTGKVKELAHLPEWTIKPVALMNKLLYGYSFYDVKPIESLPDNQIPICFMHGEADGFVKPNNSVRMNEVNGGPCELHLFPEATHANCAQRYPEEYEKLMFQFIDQVLQDQ